MSESRVIVMTGATRGLGRALVDRFVEAGHTVVGCGSNAAMVSELSQRYPHPHDFETLDVREDGQILGWSRRVFEQHGPPHLLINNAGVINETAPLWQVSPADFDRVIDVNIKGVANIIRHFVPAMIEQGRGVIVNLSSGWGRSTSPEVAPYCATELHRLARGITGLQQALAQELPTGMAAIPLNPGIINTEMLQSCFGSAAGSYPGPEEWSHRAAPFLLGLGPSHNGEPLTVPG